MTIFVRFIACIPKNTVFQPKSRSRGDTIISKGKSLVFAFNIIKEFTSIY